MTVENQADIDGLKRVGYVVAFVLKRLLDALEPGITTAQLDALAADLLAAHGARSAPKLTYSFPGHVCISVNEEVAHGIPGPRALAPGDIVNVDVSAELDGVFADTGGTQVIPPSTTLKDRLCASTRLALREAIKEARANAPLNRIGKAIQRVAKHQNFKIIKNLGSHGIGRALHEEPADIPGYFEPRDTRTLRNGMVITIEPFLSTRTHNVHEAPDGWTLLGARDSLSAQFEHTMIITRGEPIIVTALS
jgi:methionyl aminopeptidase